MKQPWHDDLAEIGFLRGRGGDFRKNGYTLTLDDRWCTLAMASGAAAPEGLGLPGLWKTVPHGRRLQRIFELPLGVLPLSLSGRGGERVGLNQTQPSPSPLPEREGGGQQETQPSPSPLPEREGGDCPFSLPGRGRPPIGGQERVGLNQPQPSPSPPPEREGRGQQKTQPSPSPLPEREGGEIALGAAVGWALGTAAGEWERSWQPPSLAELEAWLAPGALTVRSGRFARQGELDTEGGRLALRFTILPHVPPGLPATRKAWLRELLLDAQWRWRMVRLGLAEAGGGGATVRAEVDLTGAPHEILEGLLETALAALRGVVSWVVAPAAFIADPARESRVLARSPEDLWASERG